MDGRDDGFTLLHVVSIADVRKDTTARATVLMVIRIVSTALAQNDSNHCDSHELVAQIEHEALGRTSPCPSATSYSTCGELRRFP